MMMTKQPVAYTYESLVAMYGALIGDAVLIQPVDNSLPPENTLYDIIDIAYDMSVHFHKLYQTPLPRTKDLTRRNLTMKQCIQYAAECIEELRKQPVYEYKQQPKGGARRRTIHGVNKQDKSSST